MSQAKELTFDDLIVGREFPPVEYELGQNQVLEYVAAVDDLHPLYMDEEFTRGSKYGSLISPPTIAAVFTTLRVVLKEAKIPPGAIHTKQYFKFIKPVRAGDVKHSQAAIEKITAAGFTPTSNFDAGLEKTIQFFANK